ncbi:MAG: hypothetical protein ACI93T_002484 [Porticoccaceae bacterium]|jgi:hypothetical protein
MKKAKVGKRDENNGNSKCLVHWTTLWMECVWSTLLVTGPSGR